MWKVPGVSIVLITIALTVGCGSIRATTPKDTQPPITVGPVATATMLNSSCLITSLGWVITFANPNDSDVTVRGYSVVFFNGANQETGSKSSDNNAFIVAADNSYRDIDNHSISVPVPPNSVSCRLSSWEGN